MTAQVVKLEATKRDAKPGAVRAAGQVPAVLYGYGVENQTIQVEARRFDKVLAAAGSTTLVNLSLDGQEHNVLVREVQLHPLKGDALHADFYQVNMEEEVKADVPLTFTGEASAVKDLGGVLVRNIDSLEVEALPADLPREIEVDISVLTNFEIVIKVEDIKLPDGVTVLRNAEDVVALVQAPRTEEELEALEEEVSEDVEAVEGVEDEPAEGEEAETEGEAAEEKPAEETSDEQTGE